MKLLLVVELVVLIAMVGAWAWWSHRDDPNAAAGNGGLHGMVPPQGQRMVDLSSLHLQPAVAAPSHFRDRRVILVGTCFDCRSGEIVGGALRRLATQQLPSDVRVVIAGWAGDARAWREKWSLPAAFAVHGAATAADGTALAHRLGLDTDLVNSSGSARLYDASGRWRSTFPAQLMQVDDIMHDLHAID